MNNSFLLRMHSKPSKLSELVSKPYVYVSYTYVCNKICSSQNQIKIFVTHINHHGIKSIQWGHLDNILEIKHTEYPCHYMI